MRTVRTKVYQFSELSKEAQQKVIEKNYDINVNYDWWEFICEDAENIGLKIKSFDIDRASYVKGEFTQDAIYTAEKIKIEHGENCDTYKTAENFLAEYMPIAIQWEKDNEGFYFLNEDESEDMCNEFLKSLCEDYRIILSNEYDYLTSEAAIKETIEANEYEFTKEGNRF